MPGLIQRQDDIAAPRQLDGERRLLRMGVDKAVNGEDGGGRRLRGRVSGPVKNAAHAIARLALERDDLGAYAVGVADHRREQRAGDHQRKPNEPERSASQHASPRRRLPRRFLAAR